MPLIVLRTEIKAAQRIVFDLSRSIDLHVISMHQTGEKAIAGRTSGLIELNESVTWEAKHLGIVQTLTTRITEMNSPHFFVDVMTQGVFKKMEHKHSFSENGGTTVMIDHFTYISPYGVLGRVADKLFLKKYMKSFLRKRNQTIKDVAESEDWNKVLK